MGAERVVVLRPDPADPFGHLHDLGAEAVRVAPESGDGTLEAQELVDLLPKQERHVHLVALDPLHVLGGVGRLGLSALLGLGYPLGPLLGCGQLGAEPLEPFQLAFDRHTALSQGVQLGRTLHDGGE